ncbi:uncharacterized protein LOC135372279 [Ornithodoros turicata]|uniref:uncharacterized protein LOC135372279 n=1 Tax=Ornithodoros turicata TaxID=34597 RepID=UPI00313A1672
MKLSVAFFRSRVLHRGLVLLFLILRQVDMCHQVCGVYVYDATLDAASFQQWLRETDVSESRHHSHVFNWVQFKRTWCGASLKIVQLEQFSTALVCHLRVVQLLHLKRFARKKLIKKLSGNPQHGTWDR